MSRQTWRHQARIETADGFLCWQPVNLALSLVASGLSTLQFEKPLIIRLIGIKRVGNARIPDDCKNFIEEYVATAGYRFDSNHRTRKPRWSVEYIPPQDGYIPLPTDFGR